MMKYYLRHILLLTLVLVMHCTLVEAVWGQVVTHGIIKEYRGADEKVPLAGVTIQVQNAANAVSDSTGNFILNFRTLHAGDLVTVRRIEKAGYEIFNKEALEQWIISGRTNVVFTIVMCPTKKFKLMRDTYERAASANYEAQFQKEKAKLAQRRQEGSITSAQYEKGVQKATAALQQSKTQASAVAEKFSRIDLSEVSKTEREVISMVQEGKIQQAILTAEERGDMMHMAELYMLAGGVENMEKADSLLRRSAWSDTTQTQSMLKFADFAYLQADWSEARTAYEIVLRHLGNNIVQRAWSSHRLSLSYIQLGLYDQAQKELNIATADIDSLYKMDAERWKMDQLNVRLSLSTLLIATGQQEQAREYLTALRDSCLSLLAQDSTQQDILRQLVLVENHLGDVYEQLKDYTLAQKTLQSALMRTKNLEKGELERAGICNSLGHLYFTTGHPKEAEIRYKQSERMLLPLMARNPQGVMPLLARCYYNLYRLCLSQEERKEEAARYQKTAIVQYGILAERQPATYQCMLDSLKNTNTLPEK